jgi:hypothetical protein
MPPFRTIIHPTVHDKPGALTFQLEGRLAGPWVQVLQECWHGALARQRRPILRVDLTEATSVDATGRDCLAAMYRRGAEFVAADCLMKAVVAEITSVHAGPRDSEMTARFGRGREARNRTRCNMRTPQWPTPWRGKEPAQSDQTGMSTRHS